METSSPMYMETQLRSRLDRATSETTSGSSPATNIPRPSYSLPTSDTERRPRSRSESDPTPGESVATLNTDTPVGSKRPCPDSDGHDSSETAGSDDEGPIFTLGPETASSTQDRVSNLEVAVKTLRELCSRLEDSNCLLALLVNGVNTENVRLKSCLLKALESGATISGAGDVDNGAELIMLLREPSMAKLTQQASAFKSYVPKPVAAVSGGGNAGAHLAASAATVAAAVDVDREGAPRSKRRKRGARGKLPPVATRILRKWLFDHQSRPYPTEEEKQSLVGLTGLTLIQINNWFSNARRRILKKPKRRTLGPSFAKYGVTPPDGSVDDDSLPSTETEDVPEARRQAPIPVLPPRPK